VIGLATIYVANPPVVWKKRVLDMDNLDIDRCLMKIDTSPSPTTDREGQIGVYSNPQSKGNQYVTYHLLRNNINNLL
jgi:hypothetical protein